MVSEYKPEFKPEPKYEPELKPALKYETKYEPEIKPVAKPEPPPPPRQVARENTYVEVGQTSRPIPPPDNVPNGRTAGLEASKRASMTGFSLGYGLSQDAESKSEFLQIGLVHSRLVSEKVVSFNIEGNIWLGTGGYGYRSYNGSDYDYIRNSFNFFGVNVPLTVLFQLGWLSVDAGLFGDALFVDNETLYNAGFVTGAGITFGKRRKWRCFYRYNGGFSYGAHISGMKLLF